MIATIFTIIDILLGSDHLQHGGGSACSRGHTVYWSSCRTRSMANQKLYIIRAASSLWGPVAHFQKAYPRCRGSTLPAQKVVGILQILFLSLLASPLKTSTFTIEVRNVYSRPAEPSPLGIRDPVTPLDHPGPVQTQKSD